VLNTRVIKVRLGESATGGLFTCYIHRTTVNIARKNCSILYVTYRDNDAGPGDACGAQARNTVNSYVGEVH
jgi:hypothetical protein